MTTPTFCKKMALVLGTALMTSVSVSQAAELDITVTNLTRGSYFTPLLVTAHAASASLFKGGQTASSELQAMAEGGDISGLTTIVDSINANSVTNPAQGLLAPGASTQTSLSTDATNTQLSIVSMVLPTNDGFIGLNSITIPTAVGTYTYEVVVYDAGTEANDELRGSGTSGVAGMPVPAPLDPLLGNNGTGVTTTAEGFIHIHRGVLGDLSATAGVSDIDSSLHRWQNPAARVTVTVK